MSKFVLTAQLQLQAPRNTTQVLNQMRQQLSGGVNIPVSAKGSVQAQKQITQVAKATQQAASAAESMGKSFGLATKRFAAFTVASRAVSLLTNSLANSITEAIDFQREMVKIAQVSGKTMKELKGLQGTITSLASNLGTSSTELLKVTRILAQAGVQAQDLEVALAALAKTTLAATFDNIENTAEGAVAILRQFGEGVGALERQLGAINAVAGQFAVESGDLIGAVRRFGGVFKSAGGSLEELLAIFTSVRATTRESAESISTGLRTIFTRIQRPKTIAYLKQLGIELTDAEGKFVGPMKAAQLLSEALSGLAEGDLRFVQIAEELGGFRQIGKVIPLLQQFATTQAAYNAAVEGGNSLNKDAATAQQALAVQIQKVREEFQGLVRSITDSASFQIFVRTSLELASALIKVGEALAPLVPLMATFAGIRMAKGIGGFLAGAGAGLRGKNHGGRILGFNRGGLVPGTGNRDTVPAMLSPGEFVIRQSSVKKMGASTLQAMNDNRFAKGGEVGILAISSSSGGGKKEMVETGKVEAAAIGKAIGSINWKGTSGNFADSQEKAIAQGTPFIKGGKWNPKLPPANKAKMQALFAKNAETTTAYGFPIKAVDAETSTIEDDILADVSDGIKDGITAIGSRVGGLIGINKIPEAGDDAIAEVGAASMIGKMFEAGMTLLDPKKLSGTKKSKDDEANPNAAFDYANGIGEKISTALGKSEVARKLADIPTDAKKVLYKGKDGLGDSISKKRKNVISEQLARSSEWAAEKSAALQAMTTNKNAGGGIGGTDTVPALLTPGEFVINKSAAQSIGYANLNSMNRNGVARFSRGGSVGIQTFNNGGGVLGGGGFAIAGVTAAFGAVQAAIEALGDTSLEASDQMARNTIVAKSVSQGFLAVAAATFLAVKGTQKLKDFGESLDNWSKGLGLKTNETLKAESEANKVKDEIKGETGGESAAMGDISSADFTIAKAVLNVQSLSEGQKSGDPGRQQREFAGPGGEERGTVRLDPEAGIKGKQALKRAKVEQSGLLAERKELQKSRASKVTLMEHGLVGRRLRDRTSEQKALEKSFAEVNVRRQRASGVDPVTGKVDSSKYNAEDVAKYDAQLQSLSQQLTVASQATRDAQASFDLMETEVLDLNVKIKEFDRQIEASEDSIKAYNDAQKKETKRRLDNKKHTQANNKEFSKFGKVVRAVQAPLKQVSTRSEGYARSLSKKAREIQKSGSSTKKLTVRQKAHIAALKASSRVLRSTAGATHRLNRPFKTLSRDFKRAGNAVTKFKKRLENLRQSAGKRIRGAAGFGGRALGKVAGGIGVAGGIAGALAGIGSAITGALSQFAQREKEQAIKGGDVGGAASAAGRASRAEGYGEMFTLGGFFEAVTDPSGFVERREKRAQSAEAETATQVAVAETQFAMQELSKEGSTKFKTAEGEIDTRKLASQIGNDALQARQEIADVSDPAERAKLEAQLDSSLRQSITTVAARNVSEAEAVAMAERLAGGNAELRKQYVELAKSTVALRIAQQELVKANFDSLKMTSAFSAANVAVDNLVAGLQTGSSELGGFINQIKAAQGTIGVDATDAITAGRDALLDSAAAAGADPSLMASIRGQADVALAANQFSQGVGGAVTEGSFSRSDANQAKEQLREQLFKAIPEGASEETKKKMRQAIEGRLAKITDDNVATTDISQLLTGITEDVNKQAKGFTDSMEMLNKHNQTMSKLYQQREQLELKSAQALNKAIDIQLEAAKVFQDFGGKALTTEQKNEARIAQFNNIGALAGVQLGGGGAGDIRRVGEQLGTKFNADVGTQIAGILSPGDKAGAFAGAAGVQADNRDQAKAANDALLQFTKQRITLLKEELAIVQKKNAAEKSSLEKLLSGDIEGFISGQAAAGAGAALRTGDAGLAGLFGASALGAGFKTLEGQGLSDAEMERAAGLSLGAVGINDTRSAQILAGSTAEEEALKSEGRDLAGVMGELAQQQANFETAALDIQNATITAAQVKFNTNLREVSERNVQPLARGGMVYASRGMFVPRGTDTVPAMLTPGEFVVNRGAVQRGNNLQILRAMNSGGGASAPGAMSGGGVVRYYQDGGAVDGGGALASVIPNLQNVFSDFAATVDKLVSTKFQVALDPTNINVNFNGASFLETMKQDIKTELLNEVGEQIKKAKPNTSGDLKTGNTVLGN